MILYLWIYIRDFTTEIFSRDFTSVSEYIVVPAVDKLSSKR